MTRQKILDSRYVRGATPVEGGSSGSPGSSGVQSVVAGTNITVDSSDPTHPVVNATGSGGSSTWGGITGTLSDQTDLQTVLDGKVESVVAGTNVTIDNTDPKNPVINSSGGSGLIASSVVTGSAVTSLTFSGLNLSADFTYRVILSLKNASASGMDIYLFYNSDTTNSHYFTEQLAGTGASAIASNTNTARIAGVAASSNVCGEIRIVADVDGFPRAYSSTNRDSGTSLVLQNHVQTWNTAADVTSMTFTASVTNGLAVGSSIRIYRM